MQELGAVDGPAQGEGRGWQSPDAREGCLGTWLLFQALSALRSFFEKLCFAPFVLSEGDRPQKVLAACLDG